MINNDSVKVRSNIFLWSTVKKNTTKVFNVWNVQSKNKKMTCHSCPLFFADSGQNVFTVVLFDRPFIQMIRCIESEMWSFSRNVYSLVAYWNCVIVSIHCCQNDNFPISDPVFEKRVSDLLNEIRMFVWQIVTVLLYDKTMKPKCRHLMKIWKYSQLAAAEAVISTTLAPSNEENVIKMIPFPFPWSHAVVMFWWTFDVTYVIPMLDIAQAFNGVNNWWDARVMWWRL